MVKISKLTIAVVCVLFNCDHVFSNYNQDDSSSILQSALENAGITYPDQSTNYPIKRTPKSSIFSKYAWRFRFPFRSFAKDANRIAFTIENPLAHHPHHPPPLPPASLASLNGLQKPLKAETDEQPDYDQIMGIYRRARYNFQPQTNNQGPEYGINAPVSNQLMETITLKPINSLEIVSPQTLYMSDLATNEPVIEDPKMAKIRSIQYDYSGFKPIGPGTNSPLVYHAYPEETYSLSPNNQSNYATSQVSSSSSSPPSSTTFSSSSSSQSLSHSLLFNSSLNSRANSQNDIGKSLESLETGETFTASILFHPEKVEPDNKIILPVNPTDLLRLVSQETRLKAPSNDCSNRDLGWCNYDQHYPISFVDTIIRQCQKSVDQMYVEVPSNIPDYHNYSPFNMTKADKMSHQKNDTSSSSTASSSLSTKSGKKRRSRSMCDLDRKFIKPIIAQDITGNWYLIVQTSLYNQQVPVEICSKPGLPCNKSSSKCGMKTRCIQRFSTQLLISINMDKEKECPSMKLYRFPSGCVCDLI